MPTLTARQTKSIEKAEEKAQRRLKSAPTPGGNFIKIPIGTTIRGVMQSAAMETEEVKGKKGKTVSKERYHFQVALEENTVLTVGKKKNEMQKEFEAGSVVTLPDHGFLTTTLRRTACEIAGTPFEKDGDTNLKPLENVYFEITRLPDGEIASGPWAGKESALYDVKYEPVEASVA